MCNDKRGFTATHETHPTPPTIAPAIPLSSFFEAVWLDIEYRVFVPRSWALDYIESGTVPRQNCTLRDWCTKKRTALERLSTRTKSGVVNNPFSKSSEVQARGRKGP